MPKGRGSNKKGGGPTAPKNARPQGMSMAQAEMGIVRGERDRLILERNFMNAQIHSLKATVIALLLQSKDQRRVLKQSTLEKLPGYAGYEVTEQEDGSLLLTVVKAEEVPDENQTEE